MGGSVEQPALVAGGEVLLLLPHAPRRAPVAIPAIVAHLLVCIVFFLVVARRVADP